MKKVLGAAVALLAVIAVLCFSVYNNKEANIREEYIRIHIRANSNEDADQSVKLKVRDAVVTFLTPILSEAKTKEEAKEILRGTLTEIEEIADLVLSREGFSYSAKATLDRETFPKREYNELTLKEGIYDALIINLGEGAGDNWWCIAFPPLCFIPEEGAATEYRSKILEIIEEWKEKNEESND